MHPMFLKEVWKYGNIRWARNVGIIVFVLEVGLPLLELLLG